MYVCMHAYVCVCMYVCMYACMHVCIYVCVYVCMYVYMYVCVCMSACMHECMQVCSVCMHAPFQIYICLTTEEKHGKPVRVVVASASVHCG
jgi:hypothetical protein